MNNSAIFAKSEKDIPEWARHRHDWEATTDVTKLKKLEVKMRLCCNSCVEKVDEAVRGMPEERSSNKNLRAPGHHVGVFDIKQDRSNDSVTIIQAPGNGPNYKQLLKKLKSIDKRAEIVHKVDTSSEKEEERKVNYVMLPNMMTPWSSSMWPIFPNFHYVQHPVGCHQCRNYSDVVCSNCGRRSDMGALQYY